jgi:hypothetical protein
MAQRVPQLLQLDPLRHVAPGRQQVLSGPAKSFAPG